MSEKYTPEEIANFTGSRTLQDAKFIQHGAQFKPNESGEPILELRTSQINTERTKKEVLESEKKEQPKVLSTFSLPDQTQELDFKAFLDKPLFDGSYYFYFPSGSDTFKNLVYESSQPFNGIKEMSIEELELPKKGDKQAMLSELNAKPLSLNEWKYLFSQLTEEQLYGVSFFPVQLDDGTVKTIRTEVISDGAGPYGYSVDFGKISGNTIRALPFKGGHADELKPHIFIRVEKPKEV